MTEQPLMVAGTSKELELGKAAEHLVCADLILSGYRAYLSDQGLPYDIVIDLHGRLIRVQVKSTMASKNVNARGKNRRIAYSFGVRRRGKNGNQNLNDSDCDIVALVAIDIRTVAYMPISIVGQTVQIAPPGVLPETKTWRGGWGRTMDQWPLRDALDGPASYRKVVRIVEETHCKHGHEYAAVGARKSYGCPECSRIRARANLARLRAEAA